MFRIVPNAAFIQPLGALQFEATSQFWPADPGHTAQNIRKAHWYNFTSACNTIIYSNRCHSLIMDANLPNKT